MAASDEPAYSNGIVGGYNGDNANILRAMIAFSAIAWFNCAELIFLILLRFKRWKGLYFASLMATSGAIIIYQIGAWGKMVGIVPGNIAVTTALSNIGWIAMICGNSLVLYSRLHLLTQSPVMLRSVLWGIIINSVLMYVPTTVLNWGANIPNPHLAVYARGYSIMERIQMTSFSLQEFLISGIYLYEARRYLKIAYASDKNKAARNIMYELVAVNVALIALDIGLLSVEYENLYEIETTFKGLVYSTKLKLELAVLSRLVKIATRHDPTMQLSDPFSNKHIYASDDRKTPTILDVQNSLSPVKSERDIDHAIDPDPVAEHQAEHHHHHHHRRRDTVVPWLTTNAKTLPQGVKTPPPAALPRQPSIAEQIHYANTEFLTSAAVIEGANDDNIRQFQAEIDEELGIQESPMNAQIRRMHRSLPSVDSASSTVLSNNEPLRRPSMAETVGQTYDDHECYNGFGVLSGPLGEHASRLATQSSASSVEQLYPGRLTGEKLRGGGDDAGVT